MSAASRTSREVSDPAVHEEAAAVELRDVSRHYPSEPAPALDRVSVSIPRGRFVAVVGASGSGKSTLLNQVTLLDRPTSGEVLLFGVAASRLTRRQRTTLRGRAVGMVFQDYQLLPAMSVQENVLLPLRVAGDDPTTFEGRFAAVMERVDLPLAYGRKHPERLSGGEQQRVAIARALVREPELLVADEPTAHLDAATSIRILELLARCVGSPRGATVILVTHNRELAFEFADALIVLESGRLVAHARRAPGGFAQEVRDRVHQAYSLRKDRP